MADYAETGRLLLGNLNLQESASQGGQRPRMKRQISENALYENDSFEPKLQRVQFSGARKSGVVPLMWSAEEDEALRKAIEKHGEKKWRQVATEVPGRNHLQCLQRWRKSLKPGLAKGHWSKEEDEVLMSLIGEFVSSGRVNKINWSSVAGQIPGRNPKQCRERWFLNLDPSINRGPWTAEEDQKLIELATQCGGRWSLISKNMPGRTENSVKTRYQSLQRQQARNKAFAREEDQILIDATLQLGRDWAKVIKHFPGRSRGQLKKRFVVLTQQRPDIVRQVQLVEEALANGQQPPINPSLANPSMMNAVYANGGMQGGWGDSSFPAPMPVSIPEQPKQKGMFKKYGSSWMAGIVDNLDVGAPGLKGMKRTNSQHVLDSVIGGSDALAPPPPVPVRRPIPRHDTQTLAMLDKVLGETSGSQEQPSLGGPTMSNLDAMLGTDAKQKGLKQTYSSWGSLGAGDMGNLTNIFNSTDPSGGKAPLASRMSSKKLANHLSSGAEGWGQSLASYESTADFKNFLQML